MGTSRFHDFHSTRKISSLSVLILLIFCRNRTVESDFRSKSDHIDDICHQLRITTFYRSHIIMWRLVSCVGELALDVWSTQTRELSVLVVSLTVVRILFLPHPFLANLAALQGIVQSSPILRGLNEDQFYNVRYSTNLDIVHAGLLPTIHAANRWNPSIVCDSSEMLPLALDYPHLYPIY